jgi:hypothetical protein
MDNQPPRSWTNDEIELRLLEQAVSDARKDNRPTVPNEDVCADMLREIADLDRHIAALMARGS